MIEDRKLQIMKLTEVKNELSGCYLKIEIEKAKLIRSGKRKKRRKVTFLSITSECLGHEEVEIFFLHEPNEPRTRSMKDQQVCA